MTAAVDLATPDAHAAQPRDAEPRRTQRFGRFGAFARSRWAAPTFVAIAPVVILVVLRVSPYFRLNNGDPFIYIGYANDFRGHVVRFGYTYYAVRWGLIFPLRAALVFGPVWGYFILKYVLYQVAIVPLYVALRQYGRRVAFFGVIVFVANPVTAQSILSTYHDSMAVPIYTAVASLLVIASRSRRSVSIALCGLAGCLVGVAINTNLFFLPIALFAMSVLSLSLLRRRKIVEMFATGMVFVVGIVAISVAGVLVYNSLFRDPDIYETTFNAMRDFSGDTSWRSPTIRWLATRRFVYAPYVVLAIALIALIRRREAGRDERRPLVLALAIAAGTLVLFVLHQFLLEGNSMEHAYYFAYVIGPTTLLLGASAGELTRNGPSLPLWVLVAPLPLALIPQGIEVQHFWLYVLVSLVLLALMFRARAAAAILVLGLTVMHLAWGTAPRHETVLAPGSFHYEPHYEDVFGAADDTSFEAYVIANEITDIVPTEGEIRRPVLFWYESGDEMLDAVQSPYLWQLTTVQRAPHPGMPTLAPEDRERIRNVVTGYLVLMARTQEEVRAGLTTLETEGYVLEFVSEQALTYDDTTLHTMVVRVLSAPPS